MLQLNNENMMSYKNTKMCSVMLSEENGTQIFLQNWSKTSKMYIMHSLHK